MKPVPTPDDDLHYVGPEGGDIQPLPSRVEDGVVYSTWELTDTEREQIAQSGRIELAVHAAPPPPVSLAVEGPRCSNCGGSTSWQEELQSWCCDRHEDADDVEVAQTICPKCGEPIDTTKRVWIGSDDGEPVFYHVDCRPQGSVA